MKNCSAGSLLRWRKDVLLGKKKYYPKELIKSVFDMVKILTWDEKTLSWK